MLSWRVIRIIIALPVNGITPLAMQCMQPFDQQPQSYLKHRQPVWLMRRVAFMQTFVLCGAGYGECALLMPFHAPPNNQHHNTQPLGPDNTPGVESTSPLSLARPFPTG